MDVIEKLLDSSTKLNSLLSKIPEESNRDVFIQQVEELLESREHDLRCIVELSQEELQAHPLAKDLIGLDQQIQEQMDSFMNVIKKDIRDFKTKQKSDVSYNNPYAATQSIDGRYYDSKK